MFRVYNLSAVWKKTVQRRQMEERARITSSVRMHKVSSNEAEINIESIRLNMQFLFGK